MKKIVSNCFIVIIAALLLTVLANNSFAQTFDSTQSATLDYDLPYPGILPDNPLYFLKTFRDRLYSFLISDPVKKAQFDLLTADKRLRSSQELFDKGNKDLAEITVSKGLNYFEDCIKNVNIAKRQGRPVDMGLLSNLELSSKKHKEVLENMILRADGELRKRLLKDLERMNKFSKEVMEFKSK